jgi:RNA polymerase sigma-70 factor, ECF subfamily
MQEAVPAFVLRLEPMMPGTKSGAGGDANSEVPQTVASDEQLMVAFSRGSVDSFGELFSRYKQPMFGFFRRRLRDSGQAEELTQETFLAIVRASSHYEPSATFRTYLYAIGFNVLRAHRRKTAFRAMFHGIEDREAVTRNTMDTDLWLRDAVNRLERVDREILLLREFEQLSYTEIAELLRLPLNTVRSRLFRARTALRDLLAAPAPKSSTKDFTEYEERV